MPATATQARWPTTRIPVGAAALTFLLGLGGCSSTPSASSASFTANSSSASSPDATSVSTTPTPPATTPAATSPAPTASTTSPVGQSHPKAGALLARAGAAALAAGSVTITARNSASCTISGIFNLTTTATERLSTTKQGRQEVLIVGQQGYLRYPDNAPGTSGNGNGGIPSPWTILYSKFSRS